MKWIQACGAVGVLVVGITSVRSMAAQPGCLHGPDETPDQAARRKLALRFSREINNEQLAAFRSTKTYLSGDKLAGKAIPGGFVLQLAADGKGYAFSIVDQSDPCRFGYFSNQDGLIYKGEVTR